MPKVICPVCGQEIGISDRLKIGGKVNCQYCNEKLIVLRLSPVELEWSDDEEWDDSLDRKQAVLKIKGKKAYGPRDADWYDEGDGGKMRTRKGGKKKSRNRRDTRQRRYIDDERY